MDPIRAALDEAITKLAGNDTEPELLLMTRETVYAECADTVDLNKFASYLREALDAQR